MTGGFVVTPVSPCYRVPALSAPSVGHEEKATWDEKWASPAPGGRHRPIHAHQRPPLTPPCHPSASPVGTYCRWTA